MYEYCVTVYEYVHCRSCVIHGQVSTEENYANVSYARAFARLKARAKVTLKYGTSGPALDLFADKKITEFTRFGWLFARLG